MDPLTLNTGPTDPTKGLIFLTMGSLDPENGSDPSGKRVSELMHGPIVPKCIPRPASASGRIRRSRIGPDQRQRPIAPGLPHLECHTRVKRVLVTR